MDDDSRVEFDLNSALKCYHDDPKTLPCSDADAELLDTEESPENLTNAQINGILNPIIDAVALNPDAIAKVTVLDNLQCLLKYFAHIPIQAAVKISDIIVSGLSAEVDIANQDMEADIQAAVKDHRMLLEIYGFLLQWVVAGLETRASEKPSASAATTIGRKGKGKAKGPAQASDMTGQLKNALEVMCKAQKLKLLRLFITTSERDTFISMFTRPVYLILENEQRVKNETIKMHAFKVLCIAVKHHGHAFGAQTSIIQNLTYFEHLSEPMAEFLQILSEQYDYPQLVDEILKDLSNKEFNNNDLKGPKSVSAFIMSLSERAPRLVMKQMTLVIKLLESESYNLRNAVIEVSGNLIVELNKDEERSDTSKEQVNAFFDLLEERFLDINPYCRSKAIQVYSGKLLDLRTKFPKRRQKVADLACRSLQDKSSSVRRNAIKLLAKLIESHPFSALHGGTLRKSEWTYRLDAVNKELMELIPTIEEMEGEKEPGNETVDQELLDDATDDEGEGAVNSDGSPKKKKAPTATEAAIAKVNENSAAIERLELTKRYYVDALRFIETIHNASEIVLQLLSARNKSEVTEAMDFFRTLDVFRFETAKAGIRRMLRLIWTKASTDEGKGVQAHLMEIYRGLFFIAPDSFTENETANFIARNMISLTSDTTAAELTSLEQLLSRMMAEGKVEPLVIQKLWQIYGIQKQQISRSQRRGAIIVLGMLALAKPEIVIKELETILRVGLGPLGRQDLGLAKYTCLALRHIAPTAKKAQSNDMGKLPNDHAIMQRLAQLCEMKSESKDWYGLAEQAVGAIYCLAKFPDVLVSEIVRRKTKAVFAANAADAADAAAAKSEKKEELEDMDIEMGDIEDEVEKPEEMEVETSEEKQAEKKQPEENPSFAPLSQLLFLVGHVAIKQIVHLEILELEFKRRKAEQEKKNEENATAGKKPKEDEDADELDLIGGTTEDDFTEGIARVREQELLYGPQSLLSNFGPLVAEICEHSDYYHDRNLQAQSTLCMAKLMCVSSDYCEVHLPLLITIMERSSDPIVRSNTVIALGDMAVCFNHLIDENTDFLYRRLQDSEDSVKRTCLMTLTFLILAGQVKVKGQLGEMAKCLEDGDKRIADLARMFFTELATKDNAVYNNFVDMFSRLSASRELGEEGFRRVVKFLASFVEKDKHAKQLSEKLAARLPRCETERQWNDVAFALSLLPHKNEEITKTVTEGFRVVKAAAA